MAKPTTPERWLAALHAEGVTDIVEMPGWRTNNRNHIKAFRATVPAWLARPLPTRYRRPVRSR